MIKRYVVNLLISIDQFFNTLLGGYPDETISSRAGKWVRANSQAKGGVWYWLCRCLHMIDPNHCLDAIEDDEGERFYRIYR